VKLWNVREIYISENGCKTADEPDADGIVLDSDRIMYLRNYLTQLQRATAEGLPVKGYFLWSLMDNFEWVTGYDSRLGLIYVDHATQKRRPKLSATFFHVLATQNALV
jgi:beta-glucosidase